MISDKFLEFDPAGTAITVSAPSTDTFDLTNPRDLGIGDRRRGKLLSVFLTVATAFAAAGAATLQIQIQVSVDNVVWNTVAQSDAIPKANLPSGQTIRLPLPSFAASPVARDAGVPRYVRLNYVVANGPFTAGTVKAELAIDAHHAAAGQLALPAGVVVAN